MHWWTQPFWTMVGITKPLLIIQPPGIISGFDLKEPEGVFRTKGKAFSSPPPIPRYSEPGLHIFQRARVAAEQLAAFHTCSSDDMFSLMCHLKDTPLIFRRSSRACVPHWWWLGNIFCPFSKGKYCWTIPGACIWSAWDTWIAVIEDFCLSEWYILQRDLRGRIWPAWLAS